jgi:hypothetical protein
MRKFCLFVWILFFITADAQDRAAWMKEARWGIMVHYLADWRARTDSIKMSPEKWNELVGRFNADSLAAQIKSTGAGYLIFTIGQNSGYYLSPNKTYERLTGITNKISKRDLIADLSDALRKRGLKFIVYLPSGAPNGDSVAKKKLEWTNGPYPNKEFQQNWEAIIKEWSLRWKTKIDGWCSMDVTGPTSCIEMKPLPISDPLPMRQEPVIGMLSLLSIQAWCTAFFH